MVMARNKSYCRLKVFYRRTLASKSRYFERMFLYLSFLTVADVTGEPEEKIKCWIIRVAALMQIPCNVRVSRPAHAPGDVTVTG